MWGLVALLLLLAASRKGLPSPPSSSIRQVDHGPDNLGVTRSVPPVPTETTTVTREMADAAFVYLTEGGDVAQLQRAMGDGAPDGLPGARTNARARTILQVWERLHGPYTR